MTPAFIKVLRPALSGATGTIKRQIIDGTSELYQSSGGHLLIVVRGEGKQLVVVAVAGTKLYQSRGEIIEFARFNQFTSIRFHTKYPERLTRALSDLPIVLKDKRKALFGRDELIYTLEL